MADDQTSYEALETSLGRLRRSGLAAERRRSWPAQKKMAIVHESCSPGAVPTLVAQRYGISTGLLYTWRKQLLTAATDGFIRCEVIAEPAADAAAPEAGSFPQALPAADGGAAATIEVELPGGTRLRVGSDVDAGALARVLDVLRR